MRPCLAGCWAGAGLCATPAAWCALLLGTCRMRAQPPAQPQEAMPARHVHAASDACPLLSLPLLPPPAPQTELGYERVKVGPTSNFVGNHMTQGAIDLVQAHLEQPAGHALLLGSTGGQGCPPPRLLSTSADTEPAGAAAPPPPRPLHRYCGVDGGSSVRVEVPVDRMRLSGTEGARVTCSIQTDRLELLVSAPCPPAAEQECGHSSGGAQPGSGSSAAAASGPTACRHLLVHPLHAAVVPARCRCSVKGLPMLPPSMPGSTEDKGEPAAAELPPEGGNHHTATFPLPPGATHIVVELCKADAELEWAALQASQALTTHAWAGGASGHPDVAALRCAAGHCFWLVHASQMAVPGRQPHAQ